MEDFDHRTFQFGGRLATSDTTFHGVLAPLDGVLSFPDRGLHIGFEYRFLAAHFISRYDLTLAGTMYKEALTSYLESVGVPLTAIVALNSQISVIYGLGADIEAFARIDVHGYEPTDSEDLDDEITLDYDDELDRVVEMSEEEFGRPARASRNAVEALEKVVIRSFEETNCGVCLEGFGFGSVATKMPCSHVFHGDCIVRWLENSCFCPLCRFALPSDS